MRQSTVLRVIGECASTSPELERDGVPHTFRQELDKSWTLWFEPLRAADIAHALAAFVY